MSMSKVLFSNSENTDHYGTMAKFKAFFRVFSILFQMRNDRKTAQDFQDFFVSKDFKIFSCTFFFFFSIMRCGTVHGYK